DFGDGSHRGRGWNGIFAGLKLAGLAAGLGVEDALQRQIELEQQGVFDHAFLFEGAGNVAGAAARRDEHHRLFSAGRDGSRRVPGGVGPFHHAGSDHRQHQKNEEKSPHHTLDRISAALVPPKPKLLDMAILTSRFCALSGTRSNWVITSGFSRLMVGGTMPSRMASRQKIASTDPAAPSRCPIEDLVEDIAVLAAALPSSRSTAPSSMPSAMVEVPWALT